ncbi:MAG: hypothetical protein D6791_03690 [Chloroflexi bacterium]|nr:MAG: hypothetical protein D6791_03690 [Chloroflexota bacterium]
MVSGHRISTFRPPISFIALVASGVLLAVVPLPLAVLGVAGLALLLAVLMRPEIGLWLLPFSVPFGSVRELGLAGLRVSATEVLIAVTLSAWLARGVARRRLQIDIPPLFIPLVLLLGTMLLSATGMYAVASTAKELVKWVEILVVYGLAYNLIQGRKEGMVLVAALLLAGSLSALYGVAGSLLRIGPPQFAILGGRLYRAFGTFGQPNPFGGYMNHSLPIAVSLLIAQITAVEPDTGRFSFARLPSTIALLGIAGVLVLGLGLSWSRGAWLGAAAGLTAVAVAWPMAILADEAVDSAARTLRRRVVGLTWLGVAVIVLAVLLGGLNVVPAPIARRIDSAVATFTTLDARGANITDANFATLERVAHWQAAWEMWRDHFWTGVGIGNYEAAYPQYRLPKWPYALGHAHNIYFNMAAETGFLGLMAYLAFVFAALWHCWCIARGSSAPAIRGLAIGVLGVLVALGVHNLFDNMYVHAMGVQLALALGVVSAAGQPGRG